MIEERDIILRLHKDDTNAFDILYWKYQHPLYRNALKLTKDDQAASDILQEVFKILWEKRHTIKPEQSVGGWLFVISVNLSVNYQRQKLQEISIHKTVEHPTITNENEDADLYQFKCSLMDKAVQKLSPQKQKVFTLCKLNGKSYNETADILNISKHTVKEYLSYSMSSIKEFVKKHSGDWRITNVMVLSSGFSFLDSIRIT